MDAEGEGVLTGPARAVLEVGGNEIESPEAAAGGVWKTAGTERHAETVNSLQRIRRSSGDDDCGHIDRPAGADLGGGIAAVENTAHAPPLGTEAVEGETTIRRRRTRVGHGDEDWFAVAHGIELGTVARCDATEEKCCGERRERQNSIHGCCAGK